MWSTSEVSVKFFEALNRKCAGATGRDMLAQLLELASQLVSDSLTRNFRQQMRAD